MAQALSQRQCALLFGAKRLFPVAITFCFDKNVGAFPNLDWDVNGIFQTPFIQVIFVSTRDFT